MKKMSVSENFRNLMKNVKICLNSINAALDILDMHIFQKLINRILHHYFWKKNMLIVTRARLANRACVTISMFFPQNVKKNAIFELTYLCISLQKHKFFQASALHHDVKKTTKNNENLIFFIDFINFARFIAYFEK